MSPVQPVPDNDVAKPKMYVFRDMDDYKARGANVDKEYVAYLASTGKKKSSSSGTKSNNGLKEKKIKHKSYGVGTITKYDGTIITTKFGNETRTLNYQACVDKGLIEFI